MTRERRLNLLLIKNQKIKLISMVKECLLFSTTTPQEEALLNEIIRYVVVDHVGHFTKRHDILQRYFYIASGIYYQNLSRSTAITPNIVTPLPNTTYDF